MAEVIINYWTIVAATIFQMALGFSWYSKAMFGNTWIALMGWDLKKLQKEPPKGMGLSVVGGLLGALIMNFVLAHFVDYAGATDWISGLKVGILIWVGFIATVLIGSVLWERKPAKLYFINVSYWLVILAVSGAIIGGWQ